MTINIPLPKDTSTILKNQILKASNFGLLFNKYVFSWPDDWKMKKEKKKEFLKQIENTAKSAPLKKEYTATQSRQISICEDFKKSGWLAEFFELKTQTRFIMGLGGTSVLETGMTIHPLYGFPYLPASGLKGLARAYAEISEISSPSEIRDIFGSEDKDSRNVINNRQGKVIFMDGLPNRFPVLELDIMNPHYGDYYQGKENNNHQPIPPADYLNPVPVFFIAVAPGETFSFAVLSQDQDYIEKAREWLVKALTDLGAGGKTNVGYGYFEPPVVLQSEKNNFSSPSRSTPKTENAETDVQDLSRIKKRELIIWNNATLSWRPNDQTLLAVSEGKKAEVKIGNDKSFVPERFRKKLFENKKSVNADITVEPLGNAFRIINIKTIE